MSAFRMPIREVIGCDPLFREGGGGRGVWCSRVGDARRRGGAGRGMGGRGLVRRRRCRGRRTTSRITGPSADARRAQLGAWRCGLRHLCALSYLRRAPFITRLLLRGGAAIVQAPSSRLPVLAVHRLGQLVYVSIIPVCPHPANSRFSCPFPIQCCHGTLSFPLIPPPSLVWVSYLHCYLSFPGGPPPSTHPCIHTSGCHVTHDRLL
ncbi:hypothetical protein B0H10DRAFT_4151 [Mycena sp. CBHHK59/15]|nr:hypothetical protein B0H10DRAFT_4151 [Mycena sp. CBHHK59/15]